MKKRFAIVFCIVVFMVFSFVGCSNNPISKIEILDNDIKTNYIVGEQIEINDFFLKITFKNNKEKIYKITEEMISYDGVDNKIVGNQKLNINIDYGDMEFDLSMSINFDLPENVNDIINKINDLPNKESVNFSHEEEINFIENAYLSLNDEYKEYVTNYEKYEEIKVEFNNLKNKHITTEFINKRFILKTKIDNLVYSLNQKDYDSFEWKEIINIHDACIEELYLNENYDKIDSIVNMAINRINKIHTINEKNIGVAKERSKEKVLEYYNNLLNNKYSSQNYLKLDLIINEFMQKVVSLTTISEIDNLYIDTINCLEDIETLKEEVMNLLNLSIEAKLKVAKNKFYAVDMNKYSVTNQNLIIEYYNICLITIKNSLNEDSMNQAIEYFDHQVLKVKTLEIENKELLEKTKFEELKYIEDFSQNIDIYCYDSMNKSLIQEYVLSAQDGIINAKTVEEIILIKNTLIKYIDEVPTMMEEAIINLPNRINQAKEKVEDIINSLDSNDYTKENWNIIESLANNAKQYFEENITIYTYDYQIDDIIEELRNEISLVITINQEQVIILEKTKLEAIYALEEYYRNLDFDQFEFSNISRIENKIKDSKKIIEKLNDVTSIKKLVDDTISAIEDIKI